MARLAYFDDIPSSECKICKSLTVESSEQGILYCTKCGREYGCVMVSEYVEFSGIGYRSKHYSETEYRNSLYDGLKNATKDDIPQHIQKGIINAMNKSQGKLSWFDVKKLLPKGFTVKNKCIAALPKLLGFQYDIHDSWLTMCSQAIEKDKEEPKMNNYYVLYQVAAICGYYTNWIPLSMADVKRRQLNKRWKVICRKLGWIYKECKCPRYIDFTVMKPEHKDINKYINPYDKELTWTCSEKFQIKREEIKRKERYGEDKELTLDDIYELPEDERNAILRHLDKVKASKVLGNES